jgi:hypothetical protein
MLTVTLLLLFATVASATLWPTLYANAARELFRAWPSARDAFVGRGYWISFSRRFGRAYALGAVTLGFAWIFTAAHVVPDTPVGAWLLFGPAILLIVVGAMLAALVVCRWAVDE